MPLQEVRSRKLRPLKSWFDLVQDGGACWKTRIHARLIRCALNTPSHGKADLKAQIQIPGPGPHTINQKPRSACTNRNNESKSATTKSAPDCTPKSPTSFFPKLQFSCVKTQNQIYKYRPQAVRPDRTSSVGIAPGKRKVIGLGGCSNVGVRDPPCKPAASLRLWHPFSGSINIYAGTHTAASSDRRTYRVFNTKVGVVPYIVVPHMTCTGKLRLGIRLNPQR